MTETFLTGVTDVMSIITDGIGLFMEPPLSYFVLLGIAAAGIGIAKGLIPRKKAK